MDKSSNSGSLQEGVSSKHRCDQKQPREAGPGERPKKGSGTTIGGTGGKSKGMDY